MNKYAKGRDQKENMKIIFKINHINTQNYKAN